MRFRIGDCWSDGQHLYILTDKHKRRGRIKYHILVRTEILNPARQWVERKWLEVFSNSELTNELLAPKFDRLARMEKPWPTA